MTSSKRTTVLIAGATGAIGRQLVPRLVSLDYRVAGLTRDTNKVNALLKMGAIPLVVDVFDSDRLTEAMMAVRPDAVIHQLTDLPRNLDAAHMQEGIARNARIRTEGTRNLMLAAKAAGVRRIVAQSIAWAYAPGPERFAETDPLDVQAEGLRALSVGGIVALEHAVQEMGGVVLRYGQLWGEGTGVDVPDGKDRPLHIDGAVTAAIAALSSGTAGAYNIADNDERLDLTKAHRDFGWKPSAPLRTILPSGG